MMQTQVKRGRGRPKGSVTKKLQPETPPQIINSPYEDNDDDIDKKVEFTEKELKFIRLYFTGEYKIEDAMKLAGYNSSQDKYLQYVARKILVKYESNGQDHRKIFRAIGLGEIAIAQGILKLATTAKSEMVRLNAWALAAKCLGLQKEVVEGVQGIQIIIKGRDEARKPVPGGGWVNREQSAALLVPPKTLMITR